MIWTRPTPAAFSRLYNWRQAPRASARRSRKRAFAWNAGRSETGISHHTLHRCGCQAAGSNRNVVEISRSSLGAESKVREPAPGGKASIPGKPRNFDERLHAHGNNIGIRISFSEATLCRPDRCRCWKTTVWLCRHPGHDAVVTDYLHIRLPFGKWPKIGC